MYTSLNIDLFYYVVYCRKNNKYYVNSTPNITKLEKQIINIYELKSEIEEYYR